MFDIDNQNVLEGLVHYPCSFIWIMAYSKTACHAIASQAAPASSSCF